jgi:hypothetical protein
MNSSFDVPRVLDCSNDSSDPNALTCTYRFVIIEVTHPQEGVVHFLRVGRDAVCREHISLVNALNIEIIHYTRGSEYPLRCIGGGFFRVDVPRKKIRIYGHSGRYQKEPDRETRTVRMLQELFPESTIEVDSESA